MLLCVKALYINPSFVIFNSAEGFSGYTSNEKTVIFRYKDVLKVLYVGFRGIYRVWQKWNIVAKYIFIIV